MIFAVFRSVAVNSVYKLQFFYIYIVITFDLCDVYNLILQLKVSSAYGLTYRLTRRTVRFSWTTKTKAVGIISRYFGDCKTSLM